MRGLIVAASILGLLLVAAGAAAGHVSAPPLPGSDADAIALWLSQSDRQARLNTALLFGFAHLSVAMIAAALPWRSRVRLVAGWMFLAGVVLFSGTQCARIVFAKDGAAFLDMLTPLVPIGGIAFLAAWLLLGLSALSNPKE